MTFVKVGTVALSHQYQCSIGRERKGVGERYMRDREGETEGVGREREKKVGGRKSDRERKRDC